MKRLLPVLVLISLWLVSGMAVRAQGPVKRIFVTVLDRMEHPILDISQNGFEVTEGGKSVTVVRASLVTEPMRIALLVDTSDYAKPSITYIRSGLHAFLESLPIEHEILLMSLGGQARVRVPPTLNRTTLTKAGDGLFSEGGASVLLDAMRESWDRFLRNVENRWPVVVVIGTDGPDNSGTRNPQLLNFISDVQNAAGNVHAIMLSTSPDSTKVFTSVTAALNVTKYTGGHYEALAAPSALPERLKKLAAQIIAQQQRVRTQYEVDFISQSTDPQARIGVYVARTEVAGIALTIGRPIE